ncbi:hypothetical protein Nepgr_008159 [Nepenthes gracilis]|uniref:GATA-type domain-containing protein n=1 Tax=Nepenthes gracilis TaxID=150966 RepID=A0AAD3S8D4_NEPGR|nr:hypothetical protein Nepgr_008159 [Nepenthes gracilis]
MHSCGVQGPCTCGLFLMGGYPMANDKPWDECDAYSSLSPSVDCTLSLGTPSTRRTSGDERQGHHERRSGGGGCASDFCWDLMQQSSKQATNKGGGRGGSSNSNSCGGDPLQARRCANCDTTSTPLWRNGPRGPKSLCNACGIRFKKEERRATAAAATTTTPAAAGMVEQHHMTSASHYNNSWGGHQYYHSQTQKMQCFSPAIGNEFRFIEDVDNSDAGIHFLSWRLNVTDRPSLVHDFTR